MTKFGLSKFGDRLWQIAKKKNDMPFRTVFPKYRKEKNKVEWSKRVQIKREERDFDHTESLHIKIPSLNAISIY